MPPPNMMRQGDVLPDRALHAASIVAWLITVPCVAVFVYVQAFVRYVTYDDEGYLMISISKYLDGLPLYSSVFTQYGPFYYVYTRFVLAAFAAPVSHDVTRLMLVAHWLAIAALCAWCVHRLTRSAAWSLATFIQVVYHCRPLVDGPGHPQEVTLLLLGGLLLTSAVAPLTRGGLATSGLLVAFGALTKINFGIFAAAGVSLAVLACRAESKRWLSWVASAGAVAMPFVLMRRDLQEWAFPYAAVCAAAIIGCCLTLFPGPRRDGVRVRRVWIAIAACGFAVLAVVAVPLAGGTPLRALIDALFVRPLELPVAYPMILGGDAFVVAAVSVALAVALTTIPWRGRNAPALVLSLQAAFGLAFIVVTRSRPDMLLPWLGPFVWIVMLQPDTDGAAERYPRYAIGTVAAFQLMMAYPFAGTQRDWATLAIVPIAAICLAEPWKAVVELTRSTATKRVAEAVLVLGLLAVSLHRFNIPRQLEIYRAGTETSLWGFSRARMPPGTFDFLEPLTLAIQEHCDTFISMPGYNSLYFWSRIDPPTGLNAGAWMTLLNDEEQQRVVQALEPQQRACAIVDEPEAFAWAAGRDFSRGPLVQYVRTAFKPALTFGNYDLRVRAERPWP